MTVKVFGLGLNKTGTSTLGVCFKHFGFRHVSCRPDLLRSYRAGNLAPIWGVADAHDTFEDWPWPLMYRELYERYADCARYILTVRSSPEVWLESLKKHSLRTHPSRHCRMDAYGYNYPHGHEAEHLAAYAKHNAEVRAFFAGCPELFLEVCWENGEGWGPLCSF